MRAGIPREHHDGGDKFAIRLPVANTATAKGLLRGESITNRGTFYGWQRHLHKMKPRTQFLTALALLLFLLGVTWFSFSARHQETLQTFPATVNRDCAPWDGSAFTVSIPMNDGAALSISIWQAPDIKLPVTFSFPDDTGQIGNASYQLASGEYEQLSGTVSIKHVEAGSSVEGRFDLVTVAGQRFEGQFKADWKDTFILCG